ncbi:acidic mammalian chitinase-like [Coccinella septempunctata]|uniref:acidic mammalian chitinase-like n=1 Tax=Coccinella septempunctata TaxID=41139 RepID=UPI001D071813|nr:acidic mammalian chitinase-like [Coccinella septempunctata]
MRGFLCFSALLAFVAQAYSANVVCYFNSWTVYRPGNGKFVPQNIDPNLCSHILYAFVGLNSDGSVHILDSWEAIDLNGISDLINLKQQNKDLKILLSMGGWNEGSSIYSAVVGNPTLRANMVRNVVAFVRQYGFDGFDLSWEFPNARGGAQADVQNLPSLLVELKASLGDLTLSVAGSGWLSQIDTSYDVPVVANTVDMINVMSYDFHGSYDGYVAHSSPLYQSSKDRSNGLSVNATIHHWIARGAPASKLNMGIVTYGRGFTLTDPAQTDLHAHSNGPSAAGPYTQEAGMMGYNEICEFDSNWQRVFDEETRVPHIINGDQWIGVEDAESVGEKAQFAKELGLGGVAVYSYDTDDFNGICGGGKYPLINKIKSVLQ